MGSHRPRSAKSFKLEDAMLAFGAHAELWGFHKRDAPASRLARSMERAERRRCSRSTGHRRKRTTPPPCTSAAVFAAVASSPKPPFPRAAFLANDNCSPLPSLIL